MVVGAIAGGLQGFIVAYAGVPAFIVTLGGFLVWRGLIFRFEQGQTLAPLDQTFQLLGGGSRGLARRVEELGARRRGLRRRSSPACTSPAGAGAGTSFPAGR